MRQCGEQEEDGGPVLCEQHTPGHGHWPRQVQVKGEKNIYITCYIYIPIVFNFTFKDEIEKCFHLYI